MCTQAWSKCRVFYFVAQEILLVHGQSSREFLDLCGLSGICPQLSANTVLILVPCFLSPVPPKLWIFAASLHHLGAELPRKFVLQGSQLLWESLLFKSNLRGRVLSPARDRLNQQKKKRLIKLKKCFTPAEINGVLLLGFFT